MPGNGRAVAILIDPETDTLSLEAGVPMSFPAFCLVQLHVSNDGKTDRLDATAYFRKQEMRYWWPVNVAEVGLIMSKVAEDMKDIKIGSITTVAAIAVWQPSRSRVAIPKVERLYLQDHDGRTMLSRMAALLTGCVLIALRMDGSEAGTRRGRCGAPCSMTWSPLSIPPATAFRSRSRGIAFLRRSVEAQLAVSTQHPDGQEQAEGRDNSAQSAREIWHRASVLSSTGTDPDDWKGKLEGYVKQMSGAKGELSRLIIAASKVSKKAM